MQDVFKALGDITNPNQPQNSEVNPSTDERPLYVRLNEIRTDGLWLAEHDSVLDENSYSIAGFGSLNTTSIANNANSEYTALAVNNLHILAEALERFMKFVEARNLDYESSMIRQAKAALASIS